MGNKPCVLIDRIVNDYYFKLLHEILNVMLFDIKVNKTASQLKEFEHRRLEFLSGIKYRFLSYTVDLLLVI